MDVEQRLAAIAAAIAEPARARMLCALMDRRARTATELCATTELAASTTSTHLARLVEQQLLACVPQGRHRYYALASDEVGAALESLLVIAGRPVEPPRPRAPERLRLARTCYDHLAGTLAVGLHERLLKSRWLQPDGAREYRLLPAGERALDDWGVDLAAVRTQRRRFACACLDWSERRSHLGGALGAAVFQAALRRRWLTQDLEGRGVRPTPKGEREWLAPLGVAMEGTA
ncbi:ArsR/SmtB family transcription factor [Ideonella sp. BN130291]|uniref:ArsR/SmtB family transcription factor n=1 Tax=Ideonella sp. BN130291 TaxID=3112940 RepID=UPI002E262403|nr:helix-turn-helix domain-containing protein [Ideonella sp. BN130291]